MTSSFLAKWLLFISKHLPKLCYGWDLMKLANASSDDQLVVFWPVYSWKINALGSPNHSRFLYSKTQVTESLWLFNHDTTPTHLTVPSFFPSCTGAEGHWSLGAPTFMWDKPYSASNPQISTYPTLKSITIKSRIRGWVEAT